MQEKLSNSNMKQLIWLAVNLHRSVRRSSDTERKEVCCYDTLDNELFKASYYSDANEYVDVFSDGNKYKLDTHSSFKLASKRNRRKDDSVLYLSYNRQEAKDIVSIIYECFDVNMNNLPEELRPLTRNQLYKELAYRYNQDEKIKYRFESKSAELITLLKLNNPELANVDLLSVQVWDFQLEQFELQPLSAPTTNKLFSTGNIVALGLAVLLLYLIIKFWLPVK